jgi:TRAP-type mannitol/chloroaromatic compound transport system permease small subunit
MKPFRLLDRAFGAVVVASNGLASFWIFVMTAMVVADVTGRYLFNAPLNGATEIVTESVVAVLYMQIAYTLRSGRMTRSDALYSRLLETRPRVGHALGLFFHAAGACLMAAIMSAGWSRWLDAYRSDFYVGVIGVFTFPEWPMLLTVFLGCGFTAVQFFVLAVDNLRVLCGMEPLNTPPRSHAGEAAL